MDSNKRTTKFTFGDFPRETTNDPTVKLTNSQALHAPRASDWLSSAPFLNINRLPCITRHLRSASNMEGKNQETTKRELRRTRKIEVAQENLKLIPLEQ